MFKKPKKSAKAISFENGYFSAMMYHGVMSLISKLASYFKAATRIAVQNLLHNMPELRSFLWYRRILRVSEINNHPLGECLKMFPKGLDVPILLPQKNPIKKFPNLGIEHVQFWIFCILQKIISLKSSVKCFVQEIICMAKQQSLFIFTPLKMNYKGGCKNIFSRKDHLALFIISINSKNEKSNRIVGNNYCIYRKHFIESKYNL